MHARHAYANTAYTYPPLYALYALYVVGSCPRYTARLKCYVDVVSGYGWIRRGHEYYNSVTMTVRNISVRWSLVKPSPSDRTCEIRNFSFTKIEIQQRVAPTSLSAVYVTEILAIHILPWDFSPALLRGNVASAYTKQTCTWRCTDASMGPRARKACVWGAK